MDADEDGPIEVGDRSQSRESVLSIKRVKGVSSQVTITSEIVWSVVRPPPAITVDKTNDADGDGSFNDSETAPASGAPVTFQAIITNTGGTSLTLTDLTDEYPGVGPTVVWILCQL